MKIRDPAWLTKLREHQTPGAVVHPPSAWPATLPRKAVRGWRPLPERTESDLNTRTAATLGLLTPARTTLNPLTSFLPPQTESEVRPPNAPG
ncbi:MAG: hypothetical protein M3422_05570 [Actinomycetota bacterium]|nr:hypothetical protein [Actinomycetota bacterium]